MPGVVGLIGHMLKDSQGFFDDLRRLCNISSIKMPKEAYAEWLNIKLWAEAERGGWKKAQQMLQSRMDEFFVEARSIVQLSAPLPGWDAARWERQLKAWKVDSKAIIVAYPPDWQAKNSVQEIWIFSDSMGGQRYSHVKRDYAKKKIEEDLERFNKESVAEEVPKQDNADASQQWVKYNDPGVNRNYWYCEADGFWFYENDKTWAKFFDDTLNRQWWHCANDGRWFYEPRAWRIGPAV